MTNSAYSELLESKKSKITEVGFNIETSKLNPLLFPFQKFCVQTALKKGRYALFQDCGLGKTFEQLEWACQVVNHTHKPVLILAPLAVAGQTIREGIKFGIEVIKLKHGVIDKRIYITNYEQLENIIEFIP